MSHDGVEEGDDGGEERGRMLARWRRGESEAVAREEGAPPPAAVEGNAGEAAGPTIKKVQDGPAAVRRRT